MTHLLALIFLALCAIAILMATPQEDRGTALNAIVGTLVTLLVLSWLWPFVALAGYWAWTTLTPWGVLGAVVCVVFLFAWYFGRRRRNQSTLETHQKEEHSVSQIDPMLGDGIMFRGKRLSSKEYMTLPASEKARWQDEANRLLDAK